MNEPTALPEVIAHPELIEFPVIVELPVRWGDMDAFAHVNNTAFFRFFEVARVAFFDAVDFREGGQVGPILGSTSCRFRRPLKYPDLIQVGARVISLEDDRFTHEYRLTSSRWDDVAAQGEGVVVAYDYSRASKVDIPEAVRRRIRSLQPLSFRSR